MDRVLKALHERFEVLDANFERLKAIPLGIPAATRSRNDGGRGSRAAKLADAPD